jgi:hypothetical protein
MERKLAAILCADVYYGYSRLIALVRPTTSKSSSSGIRRVDPLSIAAQLTKRASKSRLVTLEQRYTNTRNASC